MWLGRETWSELDSTRRVSRAIRLEGFESVNLSAGIESIRAFLRLKPGN